jgi:hypothetical protein
VHIIVKQGTVIQYITSYTIWKKISPCVSPVDSQNTLGMIVLADSCVLYFLGGGDLLQDHSMVDCFDSAVK